MEFTQEQARYAVYALRGLAVACKTVEECLRDIGTGAERDAADWVKSGDEANAKMTGEAAAVFLGLADTLKKALVAAQVEVA